MKRLVLPVCIVFAVTSTSCTSSVEKADTSATHQAGPSTAQCPAPVFAAGDRWQFFTGSGDTDIREYVRTEGDTLIFRDIKGHEWPFSKDFDLKKVIRGGYEVIFEPDNGFYRFPLFVGKT